VSCPLFFRTALTSATLTLRSMDITPTNAADILRQALVVERLRRRHPTPTPWSVFRTCVAMLPADMQRLRCMRRITTHASDADLRDALEALADA
jgi:hypothetical protein